MPRKGDGIARTTSGGWRVDFKVKQAVRQPDGTDKTVWMGKTRVFDTLADAQDFKAEVRRTSRAGEVWHDKREDPVVSLGTVATAFAEAVANPQTRRTRTSYLKAFTRWAGEDTAVTRLSTSFLEAYARSLPSEGRQAATKHRKVLEVESMWVWARRRPDLYPGVPEPMRITGRDSASVQPPPPVVRLAAPTFEQLDLMIAHLRPGWRYGDLTRRVAILLRYTGLRVAQAIGLRWSDVQLDYPARVNDLIAGPYLVIRARQTGAKRSKGRAIPLHPALVEEMRSWGGHDGLVFEPGDSAGATWGDGEACRVAYRTAWEAAGVPREVWDVTDAERSGGDRAHGTPTHAFRAAVKVGLLRAGISDDLASYYVGHSKGTTSRAYVPEHAPETSPYWPHLVGAVAKIPMHRLIAVVHPHPRWGA